LKKAVELLKDRATLPENMIEGVREHLRGLIQGLQDEIEKIEKSIEAQKKKGRA
jgi:hypothetical protein